MKTQTKLLTRVIGCVLATSTVLSATAALADPYKKNHGHDNGYHNGHHKDRYYNNGNASVHQNTTRIIYRTNDRYDDDNRRTAVIVRLPNGSRRVVYNNRVYYTPNNRDYYAYDSSRRGYVVVNLSGVNVRF